MERTKLNTNNQIGATIKRKYYSDNGDNLYIYKHTNYNDFSVWEITVFEGDIFESFLGSGSLEECRQFIHEVDLLNCLNI